MRSREDIERNIENNSAERALLSLQMEILLDIRDLVQKPHVDEYGDAIPPGLAVGHAAAPPEKDELFGEAISFVQKLEKGTLVNAALIRDAFGISYRRASILIDQLETHGVISTPDPKNGNRRRVV